MTNITIQQKRGPTVTITKTDGQSVSVNQTRAEISLQTAGIQGGRGPEGPQFDITNALVDGGTFN